MIAHVAVMGVKGLPAKGGGERVADAIIRNALRIGYKITLYGKKNYCGQVNYGPNFRLIPVREFKGKHLSALSFGILSAFHALLFGKYDIIHLHYADFGFLVPFLRLRFKVLATSHGAECNRGKWNKLVKLCFKLSEFPFVNFSNVCSSVSRSLAQYYTAIYKRKVHFIPNGTDLIETSTFSGQACARYGIPEGGYLLFAAGRVIPSKGCDLLLIANRKLNLHIPLIIIGRIEEHDYYLYLKSLSMGNVMFIDFISNKTELMEIISNSRFFIFPSTYEAMSMMLLEVASQKKGILCSDIRENVDAIGNNAVFFTSGDATDLAEKIRSVLDNASALEKLADNAYEYVKSSRNWETITSVYGDLYVGLCDKKPAAKMDIIHF